MITIYDPTGCVQGQSNRLAHRVPSLSGVRVGILDNSKANAGVLLEAIADRLALESGAHRTMLVRKSSPSIAASLDQLARLRADADVVITGTAD